MSDLKMLAWQPLIRPPLPSDEPPVDAGALDVPLKALSCRNQMTSVASLIVSGRPFKSAKLKFGDLVCGANVIPSSRIRAYLVGPVPMPEAGPVMDPIYEADEFAIDKSASLHISIDVPKDAAPGAYSGPISLEVGGKEIASNRIELEVANVTLSDVRDWSFFLNVWMNPASVARRHNVELWSDEHFGLMRPYVADLAAHGQKTAVVPICYQPWGTQTRDPYPNAIIAKRRKGKYEFDFSIFDRYVRLHEELGIDRAIHCYSPVSGPGGSGVSNIEYSDMDAGQALVRKTMVGDRSYVAYWKAFLKAFEEHLHERGWLEKTYLAFDEKPPEVMERLFDFLDAHGQAFKISLAGNTSDELLTRFDDLSLHIHFNERGVDQVAPAERSVLRVSEMLRPDQSALAFPSIPNSKLKIPNPITTFYVCCGPAWPNTFVFSPLVESRMLPFLSIQGGYDGFLRWSYNDWPDDPYEHPEWGSWPTGDVFFVYPGKDGPVSSLRWEQLREGICDYELAMIAAGSLRTPEDVVDYEQAVTLACRNPDGRAKSVGDIELARRLLIGLAAKTG